MECQNMVKNFWKLESLSPFSVSYVYADHQSYFADALFAQEKIKWRITYEMAREDSPYCVIFCKIRKKDEERFTQMMEKLANKILLCKGREYETYCLELENMISGKENEKKQA